MWLVLKNWSGRKNNWGGEFPREENKAKMFIVCEKKKKKKMT